MPAFQQSVSPSNLPALKYNQFQFLLRFPAEFEREWIRRFHNNGWPFTGIGFHIDEHLERLKYHDDLAYIPTVLLVYSVPFDLLKHMRCVNGYKFFTRHLTTVTKNVVYQNIEWQCKRGIDKTQFITSLKGLRKVQTLQYTYFGINVSHHF